ncbi:MAG TPA: AMP-binding protein [Caulobacteraceae bacterium]|jgi:fatty-acyl-CoA synthase|nr:AMP-binding protein [Caulobacteraceae bacterium]
MAEPSLVRGADVPPLLEATIGAAFDDAVRRWPRHEALVSVHQGARFTFAELGRRVDAVAAAFVALGMEKGDRVGVWAPNCAEWTITQFAAAKAGLILVTINPAYRPHELVFTLNKVEVKALVCASRFKTSDYPAMVETAAPDVASQSPRALRSKFLPALRYLIKIGGPARGPFMDFDDLYGLAGEDHRARLTTITADLDRNDAINIQFTSGTTGSPKGATLSHRNILNNGRFVGLAQGLGEGDRLCIPVPLYHCFGMVMGNLACITLGATMVYPAAGFDPLATLEILATEKCTAVYGVPTMFIAMLEHPQFASFDLSTLRTGVMAGAPCPVEVMKKVIDRMHARDITIAYGMTETSPVSFQSAPDDPLDRRVSTIGRVQPHLEVKIVDPEGATVPRGERGELCTRGYSVMIGYWDDAEKTASVLRDGWMHTGDLATLDADGYANIVGRLKDMIIRGGENISPREIEDFLFTHPKIEDVQIVGVPDPKFGEAVCAWIRLRTGETADADEIAAFCRDRIAHYKVPQHIRFVAAFPMTVTGKVQKFEIRQAMIAELGLEVERTA